MTSLVSQSGWSAESFLRPVPCVRPIDPLSFDSRACLLYVLLFLSLTYELVVTSSILLCADADIVCSRAKNHYDPTGAFGLSDTDTQLESGQANDALERFKRNFQPLHNAQKRLMYFS